ncbi:MAG: HNH endonuclease [Myxococcaceae bacterium]|nr:HNH endonuclease [Myxococcaceae bacterium]
MPTSTLSSTDPDWPIRQAAFQQLAELTRLHGALLPWDVLTQGFTFRGELLYFATKAEGIFRPRQMRGGALSIKTTVPRRGRIPRYEDLASDDGAFFYRFKGGDPGNHSNQLLARAKDLQAPLIYFYGVEPGMYRPIWPAYISRFDARTLTCEVMADESMSLEPPGTALHDATADRIRRGYITVQAKKRIHQEAFRLHVLHAYEHRCAICRLPRPELLQAAHILPDRDERGVPAVPNGLALCHLHHGAFDADLLGISPNGRIELSRELRDTRDGPTLEHALKAFDGQPIQKPVRPDQWPREAFLEERYARFLRRAA